MPKNLQTALLITLLLSASLFGFSAWYGKENAFLLLNANLGPIADQVFRYCTYFGDGIIWVPVTLLILAFRRQYWILAFACIIISTLIAQLSKNIFFKGLPRPSLAITDSSLFHHVAGVELHTMNSFPSGHTTTAFTIFFMACFLIDKKWIVFAGFLYALVAAYSRVYLAQHFPLDLAGGMLSAIITIICSVSLQNKWGKI
jgi:membrane-associated phospholipid phosphatase